MLIVMLVTSFINYPYELARLTTACVTNMAYHDTVKVTKLLLITKKLFLFCLKSKKVGKAIWSIIDRMLNN